MKAVGLPGVLANDDQSLGMLEVAVDVGIEHPVLQPAHAGLFLGQRVGLVFDAQCRRYRCEIAAPQVIALPATTIAEDLVAAMLVADCGHFRRNFTDRGIPVDLFETAIFAASQRTGQPVTAMHVIIELQRLVAGIAARNGVIFVALYPQYLPTILATSLHQHTAIGVAQTAGIWLPKGFVGAFGHRVFSLIRSRAFVAFRV